MRMKVKDRPEIRSSISNRHFVFRPDLGEFSCSSFMNGHFGEIRFGSPNFLERWEWPDNAPAPLKRVPKKPLTVPTGPFGDEIATMRTRTPDGCLDLNRLHQRL